MQARVALVSGGGRGIGSAIAKSLAAQGCDIAVNYHRNVDQAEATCAVIRALGRRAFSYQASIDDDDACRTLVAATLAHFGRLDIVVNNAGISSSGRPLATTEAQEIERLIKVHTLGAFYLTRAALPHVLAAPRGDLIFISSAATKHLPPYGGPYSMAKAATEAMAFTWAKELYGKNVHVNIVAPGLTATSMGMKFTKAVNNATIDAMNPTMPFGHVCRPEEVADVVSFLCSTQNGYITGERIYVDGGVTPAPLKS